VILAAALCSALLSAAAADAKASQIVSAMTPDERLRLIRGESGVPVRDGVRTGAIGSAGYVPGVPRLGVPALQETDAGLGVANANSARRREFATAMPSALALASTWDTQLAYRYGAAVGDEAWRKGFNVLLGPGLNLARDPRNGRNFEYFGEDPLLAGTLAGAVICGVQDQHVVATIKHYALNDQETGRSVLSADIGEAAMRESDLLAFEIALERGHPGAVMCAYNRVNGTYACRNDHLLDDILKRDWDFPGWVMSDWGAVHGADAATNGLDQASDGQSIGAVPQSRLLDMNRRIVRSMLAVGLFDEPPQQSPIDFTAHASIALETAERGSVLLKNDGTLPLAPSLRRIAVIGGYADAGVLSGGGSSQVLPVARTFPVPLGAEDSRFMFFDRSSPLAAIRAIAPQVAVSFNDGRYPSVAAQLAKNADVAIVFATQWASEGSDLPDLTLPASQDALIATVAASNPRTVVVLETGNPVLMPWLDRVSSVLEAWYPGERGGDAIADVLFGRADASGRLPITFPAAQSQIVHPDLPGLDALLSLEAAGVRGYRTALDLRPFSVTYGEGADAGYRRFAKENLHPLFAFGHGLSYARFRYGDFRASGGTTLTASFTVTNSGERMGTDTPQVYLTSRLGVSAMRLLGWSQVTLASGASRRVNVVADPRLLADFDPSQDKWVVREGEYEASLGSASDTLSFRASAAIAAQTLKP
jgi:beta-glucosidase